MSTSQQPAAQLRLCVVRLARRIRQQSGADVTPSQLSALATIAKHEGLRPGALADRERISKSSVTGLITRLQRQGYIETHPDPTDGRSQVISLTATGRQLLDEADQRSDAYLARQLRALGDGDRAQLEQVLPVLEKLLTVKA